SPDRAVPPGPRERPGAPDSPGLAEAPGVPEAQGAPDEDHDDQDHDGGAGRAHGRRGSLHSVLHVVLAGGVLPLVSLATGPLLARTLGLEGRGHLSAVLAPVALVPYVLSIGLGDGASYLVARRGKRPADVALVLGLFGAGTGALGALALWLLAPVLLADYPRGIGLLRALGLTLVPAMALGVVQAARTGEGRYDLLVRERWIAGLSRLAALGGLALAGALTVASGAWAQVLLLVVAQCAALSGLSRPRARWRQAREIAREGTRFGSRAWGGELAVFVILRLDQTVMLPLAGAGQLGLYVVAVSLAEVPTMLLGDLRRLLLAEVAARRDAQLAARACRLAVVAVGLPVLAGMALTPLVVPLLFGSEFAGAVPMAVVLLSASVFSGLNLFLGGSISALGSPGTQSRAQMVSLLVAVLGIALIPPFGGMGAAAGSLLAYAAGTVVMVAVFRRLTGLPLRAVVVPQRADVAFLVSSVTRRFRRSS
ncbi:lipopolysaccharide biosynthesis protein, partial [Kineococcus indalonis]|uniref:lipopolysaccharide biosynthesis protein n=1 Tax=Kineococcus indalonis TaxID=2696566 RepID=UPI001412B5CF